MNRVSHVHHALHKVANNAKPIIHTWASHAHIKPASRKVPLNRRLQLALARSARGSRPLHVVDAVQVEHTKPMDKMGGAFYRKMRAQGVEVELERLLHDRGYKEQWRPRLTACTMAASALSSSMSRTKDWSTLRMSISKRLR